MSVGRSTPGRTTQALLCATWQLCEKWFRGTLNFMRPECFMWRTGRASGPTFGTGTCSSEPSLYLFMYLFELCTFSNHVPFRTMYLCKNSVLSSHVPLTNHNGMNYLLENFVWKLCLETLFGHSVWTLCLETLFGNSVWKLCLDTLFARR